MSQKRIKVEYNYYPKDSNNLQYIHIFDRLKNKFGDGGCLFYVDNQPSAWVKSLHRVRNGRRTRYEKRNVYVTFGKFHTTFTRYIRYIQEEE